MAVTGIVDPQTHRHECRRATWRRARADQTARHRHSRRPRSNAARSAPTELERSRASDDDAQRRCAAKRCWPPARTPRPMSPASACSATRRTWRALRTCGSSSMPVRVPFMDRVLELIGDGIVPGGTRHNAETHAAFTRFRRVGAGGVRIGLSDAQTSGGLLISVAARRARPAVTQLAEEGRRRGGHRRSRRGKRYRGALISATVRSAFRRLRDER